jgi:hypothetical protein
VFLTRNSIDAVLPGSTATLGASSVTVAPTRGV